MHVKKNDNVIVISGKYKGTTGTILRSIPKTGKVVVEGVNLRKRMVKAGRSAKKDSVEVAVPIDASNVRLVSDTKKGKGAKKESK